MQCHLDMKFSQPLLHIGLLTVIALTNSWAVGAPLCAKVYQVTEKPASDMKMTLSGVMYKPAYRSSERVSNFTNQVDFLGIDLSDGVVWERTVRVPNPEEMDYEPIGFLPSQQDYALNYISATYAQGLQVLHKNYGIRFTEHELGLMRDSDWSSFHSSLDSFRLGFGVVEANQKNQVSHIKGFLKVYDGTDYQTIKGLKSGLTTKPTLPCEILLKRKNISTDVFTKYREQGYQIFEIGKFFLDPELTSGERTQARKGLLQWLITNYLNPQKQLSDKVIFIIDVGSVAHLKAYHRDFGTEPIPSTRFTPELLSPDAILIVTPEMLLEKLLKIVQK